MKTMKVARYYGAKDIRIEEAPIPEIGGGEIKVKVKVCGICGSDLAHWYMEPRAPAFFGHEPTGVVVEVGEGVKDFKLGDRVFVHHHVPCFVCHYCQRGSYTMCRTYKETEIDPGGFAEYIRVPALNLERDTLKLPDEVSFEEATMIEPIGCCIKGMRKANIQMGDTVAVLGAGFTGAVHIQLAPLFGAAKTIAIDGIPSRLQRAFEFGADHVIDFTEGEVLKKIHEVNEGRGADVVVVTPGSLKAAKEGVALAGKGSTVYLFAPYPEEAFLPIDLSRFFFSEITLVTSYSSTHLDTRAALKLMEGKKIHAKDMITHRFPFEKINEAVQLATQAKDSLKVVMEIEEGGGTK
jgi:L-iditol 2-dehydrogenase